MAQRPEKEKKFLDAYTGEDRLLLSQVFDLAWQARRGRVASTAFLDPHQQELVRRAAAFADIELRFDGGFSAAERAVALLLPEDCEDWQIEEANPLRLLRVTPAPARFAQTPTHRDYLGSLMGLGIKREALGDIVVQGETADVFVLREMAAYLLAEWREAGRTPIRVREEELASFITPEDTGRDVRTTVASLRLDAVLAAAFSLSRTQTQTLINAGRASLRFMPCLHSDAAVEEGDTISLRGYGRVQVQEAGRVTRKGRIALVLRCYR